MLTDIGKELRRLRIDREERLLDMARRLGKSSSFISAIERGAKVPPTGFEDRIVEAYALPSSEAAALRRAADRSRDAFTLKPRSPQARDTAGMMARQINSLSPDDLSDIDRILHRRARS